VFFLGFTKTENRDQIILNGCDELFCNLLVRLMVELATVGVPAEDVLTAKLRRHRHADISRKCSGRLWPAELRTAGDFGINALFEIEKCREDGNIDILLRSEWRIGHIESCGCGIHLPIAGDERSARGVHRMLVYAIASRREMTDVYFGLIGALVNSCSMIKKIQKMTVKGGDITVTFINEQDYICLTDMAKTFDGDSTIKNWLRNRNTIEFLGIWEQMNNPEFNLVEFDRIRREAGLNRFSLSVKEWVRTTNAIGLQARAGRYGGTYAHKDIAFEFGSWLSPEFKLLLITEFQRLKKEEKEGLAWDIRRMLTKINYRIHTTAVKEVLVPQTELCEGREGMLYADEAELLNLAVFGYTSKQWRDNNVDAVSRGENMRDQATITQLTVLSNLESLNATYIHDGMNKADRYAKLKAVARQQFTGLLQGHKQLAELEKRAVRTPMIIRETNQNIKQ